MNATMNTERDTVSQHWLGDSTTQIRITQRVESGAVALLAVVAVVVLYPAWWWVILAAFVVFDLSMLGYVRSTAAGATSYNLVHNYAFPALMGLTALVTHASLPAASTASGVLACAWAFHVGVDRALGYGLKMPDAFTHTHLGRIGKDPVHGETDRPADFNAQSTGGEHNHAALPPGGSREHPMTALDTAHESDRAPSEPPRRRRRWPWIASGVVLMLAVTVVAAVAVFHSGLPWWMEEGDRNHVYESDAGSLRYQVHLPPQYDGTTRLPVVMAIHGCGMSGFGWNSMKATTQFNGLADSEGFIVVYPTQRLFRNAINCWNSADPREQHRHSGDPALLAGVARQVIEEYNADEDHVHVAGASSGAGTAVILAATYPDVFATATSVAGGEYGLNQVDPDDPDATPPDYTARQAWSQMGERARQVPLLVIQGEDDDVVPPVVATRLVEHWSAVADLVDDGLLNDSLDLAEATTTVAAEQGRHAYTHTTITEPDGTSVVESYVVRDMGHVWPGPAGNGLFTDGAGPDASAIVWDFAQRHPKGSTA